MLIRISGKIMNTKRTRQIKIRKRRGEYRTIYVPSPEYKYQLRQIAGKLESKARALDKEGISHGFTRFKSPITNAAAHVGREFTLSIDLKDFFDHVTPEKLKGKLSKSEIELVVENGAARQGLPTSPAVANIAFSPTDAAIIKWIKINNMDIIYTRYADDMTFSFDAPKFEIKLLAALRNIIGRAGFKINDRKTKLQRAIDGRRVVTGIAVDKDGVHPTRKMKRKLRAALHQKNVDEARGLSEWCQCKQPNPPRELSVSQPCNENDLKQLTKGWRLRKVNIKDIPERKSEKISNCIIISADPAMYLGMSSFTNGWTSCMNQKNGEFRKTVVSWLLLEGTRVAYLYKENDTVTFHGVERHKMHARCLVHTLKSGMVVYDKIYGNENEISELRQALDGWGALPVDSVKIVGDSRVVGAVSKKYGAPHCDNLKVKESRKNGRMVYVFYVDMAPST